MAARMAITWFLLSLSFACQALDAYAPPLAHRITTWAVLGPFPEGKPVQEAGQLAPRLGAKASGKEWRYFDDRLYCRNQDDYNDLYTFFMKGRMDGPGSGTEHKSAYCGGYLWSPCAQEVLLWFSVNDRGRVWLDGEVVFEQSETRQAMRDTASKPVHLSQGWNRILAAIENDRRIWGFYLGFTDSQGAALQGTEWSIEGPGNAPAIETQALPKAYDGQPYVWLSVRNPSGKYPWDNASASPYRMLACGGTPPYTWMAEGLPPGVSLDPADGEFLGESSALGTHMVSLTVTDSSNPPQQAAIVLPLEVAVRPTAEWWEKSTRVGGLRHHGEGPNIWTFDHVEEQIALMQRIGYAWQAYTVFSKYDIEPNGSLKFVNTPDMRRYRQALLDAGIRFAQYMSFKDFRDQAPSYKAHADHMHEALEYYMTQNKPALWWFDEMYGGFRKPDQDTVEFDALYSLIRALDPGCLITVNAEIRSREYEVGDLDMVQVHGAFKTDSYWGQWPSDPPLGNSVKYLPADSWKLPWMGYMDAQEWCRALITMLAEPANLKALRGFDLDATPFLEEGHNTVEMLRQIGDWVEPRRDSIYQTLPLELPNMDWGYAVLSQNTGDVYLHILANPLGKRGLHERGFLDIDPFPGVAGEAALVPSGKPLGFEQCGNRVMVDVRDIEIDPVDTIIQLRVKR